jgi:signal transduction histidine kinase
MVDRSQLVLAPDGTILAATGRLPLDLIGQRLDDAGSLPAELRAAGRAVLDRLRGSGERVAHVTVELPGPDNVVDVLALEALAIHRTATNLRQLLPSKLAVISSQAEAAGVALGVKVGDDVPPLVDTDVEKLAWAVTTLVGNALRYVKTPSRRLGGKAIDVDTSFDRATSQITIVVRDDGPGIPADTVQRIFIRDGVNARGAGLSLLLIRDIMVAHGGTVDLRSRTDLDRHGTEVRLIFPTR